MTSIHPTPCHTPQMKGCYEDESDIIIEVNYLMITHAFFISDHIFVSFDSWKSKQDAKWFNLWPVDVCFTVRDSMLGILALYAFYTVT